MRCGHIYCLVGCVGCKKARVKCGHIQSSEAPNRYQALLEALRLVAHIIVLIDLTYGCLPSDVTCRRRVGNAYL